MRAVFLTKSQIDNLIEFIELHFIDSIRDDEDIDNIEYIISMMDALRELRRESAEAEKEEIKPTVAETAQAFGVDTAQVFTCPAEEGAHGE